ncbi:zinc finger protein 420 isoform X4 [Agrilus planipennis]|uniref:Zinc finger protein 420 isoform X4 n=1 Tax=Agrilus planipennis TaxID=224129 RepID=A0A7F5R5Z2_AGRPL|nr:zinc finger protein 420 isoform X4 [Agrilus planipennis]
MGIVVNVKIRLGDGLPTLICSPCTDLLRASYLFKKKCEDTDNDFREHIKQIRKDEDIKPNTSQTTSNSELSTNLLEEINNVIVNNVSDSSLLSSNLQTSLQSEIKCDSENKDFIEILDNCQILLTCRTCHKSFTTCDGLRSHKRLHTGELFQCKVCSKVYTRQTHLQRHETTHKRHKVHICKICNKTLKRYEHLKRHLITHIREKPFACKSCSRGFSRAEHLANHAVRCKGDKVYVCDICNKGFNRADSLEVHKKLHENKQPVLPTLEDLNNVEDHYFEIDFEDSSMLQDFADDGDGDDDDDDKRDCFEPQVNITENTDQQIDLYSSNSNKGEDIAIQNDKKSQYETGEVISDDVENQYDHNFVDIHQTDDDANVEPAEHDSVEIITKEENVYDDDECSFLDNKAEVENLTVQNDTTVYPEQDTEFNDEYVAEESDSADSEYRPMKTVRRSKGKRGRPKKYSKSPKATGRPRGRPLGSIKVKKVIDDEKASCKECGKKFVRHTNLKRHLMSHSEIKPYQCEKCSKRFNRRDHLSTHMKLHFRKNKFQCEICKCSFSRADHLAKHQVSKHNIGNIVISEKKFKCEICQKGFTTEKYRDIHMKGHMGENTYICKTCEKTFISKSHLTEHMKFHNDHCKKFLCSECGQRFIRNDYLVIHMRRHRGEKPFKCKFCGKGFPRTTDLTVHERYHTGEKTHLCTICGRGFGRAYNLTVHMRTHTGEKPYQCTYCDAAFAQGNDLKAHIRRHTGERFHCDLCNESFLMGYLLTQHKRTVHGLNVVSNIRRLKPIHKIEKTDESNSDDPPPLTIKLPAPVVPVNVLQAQLAMAQLQNQIGDSCELKFEAT